MSIRFLPERALLMEGNNITPIQERGEQKIRTLVVADLHVGLELELARKGITLPNQLQQLEARLDRLIKQTKAKQLVLLGDIKHETAGVSWSELWDVPDFLQRLKKKAELIIVKGNHDGDIESIIPRGVTVYGPEGFVLNDVLLAHGQAWPHMSAMGAKTLVIGHIHPTVEFWSAGVRSVEHVFLRAPVNKRALELKFKVKSIALARAIIMPAFNLLVGGTAFNSDAFRPSGPLLKKAITWKRAEVWLLDGTFLGTLDKLKTGNRKKR